MTDAAWPVCAFDMFIDAIVASANLITVSKWCEVNSGLSFGVCVVLSTLHNQCA